MADKTAAASAQQNVTINAASVKLPEFIIKNPRLWLIQAEAQFRIAHITSEETKYYHIISRLPAAVLIECEDVVVETYQKDDLNKLKQALLDRYTLSTDQRIKEVLDNIRFTQPELPSAFFRRLMATASGALPYDIILQRFRERLPSNISNAIAPMTNNLGALFKNTKQRPADEEKTMLEVADAIQPQSSVSAISTPPYQQVSSYQSRSTAQHSSRGKHHSATRSRSPSAKRFQENGSWCKNHFTFREKTRTCSRPGRCTFKDRLQQKN